MASVLESIVFDPAKFQQELQAFDELLASNDPTLVYLATCRRMVQSTVPTAEKTVCR
jgi:succinate dehydrogenase flavin-adding protein (antitoxin of CptAB toxin-antitoxin module)